MDEEQTIASLQALVTGAMYTLAGLTEIIKAQPEAADAFAKSLMIKDANYEGEKPAISLATLGAALFVHKLATEALSERELDALDRAEAEAEESAQQEFQLIVVPRDQLPN